MATFRFRAKPWVWQGGAVGKGSAAGGSWTFVALPKGMSDEIRGLASLRGGWGSVRVTATVGGTTWSTSLFPSAEHKALLLPLKASVRAAEGIVAGKSVDVTVDVG